jgi:hypothetical protein
VVPDHPRKLTKCAGGQESGVEDGGNGSAPQTRTTNGNAGTRPNKTYCHRYCHPTAVTMAASNGKVFGDTKTADATAMRPVWRLDPAT